MKSRTSIAALLLVAVILMTSSMAAAKVIINDALQQLVSIKVCKSPNNNNNGNPTCDTNCTEYHAVAGGCWNSSSAFTPDIASGSFVFECANVTDGCLSAQRFIGPNCNKNAAVPGVQQGACNFCQGQVQYDVPQSSFYRCTKENISFSFCGSGDQCNKGCDQMFSIPIGSCGNVNINGHVMSAFVPAQPSACSFVKAQYFEQSDVCVHMPYTGKYFQYQMSNTCSPSQEAYNVVLSCMSSNYFTANNKELPPHISQMPKEHVEALRKMIESDKKNKVAPLGMFGGV